MKKPELVADCRCLLGDGPLWHAGQQRLYLLDIGAGQVLRLDPGSGTCEVCHEGPHVGGFTLQADGSLLLFLGHGAVRTWREGTLRDVLVEIPEERGSRFNDVIATPSGRVLAGMLPTPAGRRGSLYLLGTSGRLARLLDDLGCPNGMGFAPDRRTLYLTDSEARAIFSFDYDEGSGQLSNRRVLVHVPEGVIPDGLTVDLEGFLWSAFQGSGCVARFSPRGVETHRIELPTPMVTGVAFGGRSFRDLFITTGGGDDRARLGSSAGALFCIPEAGQGVPEFFSRVAAG